MQAYLSGFLLGFSLIVAIGAQNAFVLRQGLRRAHVFPICLFCGVSDVILIFAGVAGVGLMVTQAPVMERILFWGGVLFLISYGVLALRSAWKGGNAMDLKGETTQSLGAAMLTLAAFTWLNPHVYLDVLMIGSLANARGAENWVYASGVATASVVFFFALGYGARALAPVFTRPLAWRGLDLVVGLTMIAIAVGLILGR